MSCLPCFRIGISKGVPFIICTRVPTRHHCVQLFLQPLPKQFVYLQTSLETGLNIKNLNSLVPACLVLCRYIGTVVCICSDSVIGHRLSSSAQLSLYRPWRPLGLIEFEAPTFFRHSAHRWRKGCQPHAPAAFTPRNVPGTQFC
jgi:hypothetical protein